MDDRIAPQVRVCDLTIYSGDVDSACEQILARVRERSGGYVCLANVHVAVTSWQDPALKQALDEALVVCPDGAPVAGWRVSSARAPARGLREPIS
jgi:N-acetylglucosaminyldiphosphoundecaprenol N-acetyl-beta-D-mannosaminyltransferase